jgi:hypothetical protein
MRTSDAVDASMPLNEAHWIPRNIEVYNMTALLKVHALRQNVRRDQQIEKIGSPQ